MIVELIWTTDRFSLYNELEHRNEDATFPIRHMLWFITTNILKEANVYVDRWPDFQNVCCLHSTKLYAPKSDRDFVVLANSSDQDSKIDQNSTSDFFKSLLKERRWIDRQGLILFYVAEPIVEIAQQILCPKLDDDKLGNIWISKPLRHYTSCERENLEEYQCRYRLSLSKIDPTLIIDKLKPEEAHLVAAQWPYEIPDKILMFRWLIDLMPSVCIREPKNLRPLSWIMAYCTGASGAAYVLPEQRGKGLADVHAFKLNLDMAKLCPTKRYFWMLEDNIASLKNGQRLYFDWRRTNLFVRIFVYDSPDMLEKKIKAKM